MAKEAVMFCRFVQLADIAYSKVNGEQLRLFAFFIVGIFKTKKAQDTLC